MKTNNYVHSNGIYPNSTFRTSIIAIELSSGIFAQLPLIVLVWTAPELLHSYSLWRCSPDSRLYEVAQFAPQRYWRLNLVRLIHLDVVSTATAPTARLRLCYIQEPFFGPTIGSLFSRFNPPSDTLQVVFLMNEDCFLSVSGVCCWIPLSLTAISIVMPWHIKLELYTLLVESCVIENSGTRVNGTLRNSTRMFGIKLVLTIVPLMLRRLTSGHKI